VVAVTDIADFFPRLYHHPLENIILSVGEGPESRVTDVARVLVGKFLFHVGGGVSYGLPIGPYASSVLAEAALIDVDAALVDRGIRFVRWFDDYTIFAADESEAQRAIAFLGEWLHRHHGLTLSTAKTKLFASKSFLRGLERDFEHRVREHSEQLAFMATQVTYDGEELEIPLKWTDFDEGESMNLAAMLEEALSGAKKAIDYEFAQFILNRLAAIDPFTFPADRAITLVNVVLANLGTLMPIMRHVARFLVSLEQIPATDKLRIGNELVAFLRRPDPPSEFAAMWLLHVFASHSDWNHAAALRQIYTASGSSIVKRYAALALAKNGTRREALSTKEDLVGAKPLLRTAILAASRKLGADERKFWRRKHVISDPLEKLI
jgi:hypothetical protein